MCDLSHLIVQAALDSAMTAAGPRRASPCFRALKLLRIAMVNASMTGLYRTQTLPATVGMDETFPSSMQRQWIRLSEVPKLTLKQRL